jgi:DNA repair protein SbcD/Mre11
MQFLYISDIHLRGKNSVNRNGNYFEDCLTKLDEVISIYKKNKCSLLIIGGDLFDSAVVSNSVVDEFVDRIEKNNVQVYVIYGNHDLINCNLQASKGSSLAHIIRRSNHFNLLDLYEKDNVAIQGVNYEFNIEDKIKNEGLIVKSNAEFKVVVPHAFITIKPFHKDVSHILAKDIKTNADLVLCSHLHSGWGIQEVNSVKFVNLGGFGRLSISEAHNTPKVALVDTEIGKTTIFELSSAKKGDEIFDLTKYEELKGQERNIRDFLDSLKTVDFQAMDLSQQIIKIGKESNIEQPVIDYLLEKIGEVKS